MKLKPNRSALRLRRIPTNTVVHTPTEAEAKELLTILHENEYKFNPTYELLLEYNQCYSDPSVMCFRFSVERHIEHCYRSYYEELGYTILTLPEFKERFCEAKTPQPKFNVGDPVIITADCHEKGMTGTITYHNPANGLYTIDQLYTFNECDLSPTSEPKTIPTEDMEAKELNLCELLKGHEEKEFYSPYYGVMMLMSISDGLLCFQNSNIGVDLLTNGHSQYAVDGCCAIFPSKALYEQYPLDAAKAWSVWQSEQKKYALSVAYVGNGISGKNTLTHFLTPADRDKCTEVIDAFLSQIQQSKSVASLCEEIKVIIDKYSKK